MIITKLEGKKLNAGLCRPIELVYSLIHDAIDYYWLYGLSPTDELLFKMDRLFGAIHLLRGYKVPGK